MRLTGVAARFNRFGVIEASRMSVLLDDIVLNGKVLASHAWVPITNEFQSVEINRNDVIAFDADITVYIKRDGTMDYGLANMSDVTIINKSRHRLTVDRIKHFSFIVQESTYVWLSIK